jgi:hypothetical protein
MDSGEHKTKIKGPDNPMSTSSNQHKTGVKMGGKGKKDSGYGGRQIV